MHIAKKEPGIAAEMVNEHRLIADSCVSYEDITNQLFWRVHFELERENNKLKLFDDENEDKGAWVNTTSALSANLPCRPALHRLCRPRGGVLALTDPATRLAFFLKNGTNPYS